MTRTSPAARIAAWCLVQALAATVVAEEYRFHLVDAFTTTYGLRECYIYDINNNGVACGTSTYQYGSSISYSGFYWSLAAGKTAVGISWPHGISDNGALAGVAQLYDIPSGQLTTVPIVPGYYYPLVLSDVNDAGLAVGSMQICNCSNSQGVLQVPYLWDAVNGARTLPVPGAKGASHVTNTGLVIGWTGGNSQPDGYVYDLETGQYFYVSSLFAGPNIQTTVVDIEEDGTIVGNRREQNGQVSYGYTWSPVSGVTLLPLPSPDYQPYVKPTSINAHGVVVGTIFTPTASSRAFVYDPGNGIRDLNLLTNTAGFTLMTATAVNDAGWIVGYGYGGGGMYKSYVLVPPLAGDLNCDAAVDVLDINPFITALSGPAAYAQQYPECDIMNADVNADGNADVLDINPFVALLSQN
ncbi:hypothetical protein RAS1_41560 [Phycisphaerae bacterium RAS1]|nr:hypothetical protein RAS1_41560 [Phycisphaerae bacterium RAS1]